MIDNTRPYYWMIDYTPQREWIEGLGICLFLAFVLGTMGGGLYLVSLYFNNPHGLLAGWVIAVVVKGGIHLFELGRPLRAWRLVFRPKTSWITRGFFFEAGFGLFGALQIAPMFFSGLPWEGSNIIIGTSAPIFAFLVMLYAGFVMNYNNAIALWNNALLPVLFVIYGLLDGCGVLLAISTIGDINKTASLQLVNFDLWVLIGAIITVAVYLISASYTNAAGRKSVLIIVKGHLSPLLYLGVVVLGMALPLIVFVFSHQTGTISPALLTAAVACQLVGNFSLRYCLLKAGLYMPLVASNLGE